jgi:hypothetical protein
VATGVERSSNGGEICMELVRANLAVAALPDPASSSAGNWPFPCESPDGYVGIAPSGNLSHY